MDLKKYKRTAFAFYLPIFINFVFSLWGQPADYWQGNSGGDLSTPLVNTALNSGPIYYIFSYFAYSVILFYILKRLKLRLRLLAGMTIYIGHVFGTMSFARPIVENNLQSIEFSSIYWYLSMFVIACFAFTNTFALIKEWDVDKLVKINSTKES